MPGVFISYRREDAGGWSTSLYNELVERFGAEKVFMDVSTIPAGVEFSDYIAEYLRDVDVLLAVIGRTWESIPDDQGRPRIQDPEDLLRQEIATALRQADVTVIPVLVDGAALPASGDLPTDLQRLARLNALELSASRFNTDAERLTRDIESVTKLKTRKPRSRWGIAVAAVIAIAVAAGVVASQIGNGTTTPDSTSPSTGSTQTTQSPPSDPESPVIDPTITAPPLNAFEQVAGDWVQSAWTESPGPIVLGFPPLNGLLSIDATGAASWDMDVHDEFFPSPDGHLSCAGSLSLAGVVDGNATETRDFTSNMTSLRSEILVALCGSDLQEFESFALSHDGDSGRPATVIEMSNTEGRFTWTRN